MFPILPSITFSLIIHFYPEIMLQWRRAAVVKLVDTQLSKSCPGQRGVGSNPTRGTFYLLLYLFHL